MKKNILLLTACLVLSLNLALAQKMTICDCVTQYALMAEEMNNGLNEEEAMKKYEKTDLECTKLMDSLGESEAFEAMSACKDWDKLSQLMTPEGSDIDPNMVCGCIDSMVEAYTDYLNNGLSDEKMEEKYGTKIAPCEPIFMDQNALGIMMSCENFPKFSELMMQVMEME